MIFIWGKRRRDRKRGYVADFCPVCRGARPQIIHNIRMVPHLYYIPVWFSEDLGYLGTCMDCGTKLFKDMADFTEITKSKPAEIDLLIRQTQPDLAKRQQERLILERYIQQGNLSAIDKQVRFELLQDPFQAIAYRFLLYYDETHIDKRIVLGGLTTLALLASFIYWEATLPAENLTRVRIGVLSILAAGFYTLIALFTVNKRHIKNWVLPTLAKALRPLKPTREELEQVLASLIPLSKHYKKIKIDDLQHQIEQPEQSDSIFDPRLCRDANSIR